MHRSRTLLICWLAFVGLAGIGLVGIGGVYSFWTQPGSLNQETIVLIERGDTLRDIANQLEEEGIIESRWLFMIMARLGGIHNSLRAGEYAFAPKVSSQQVLETLRHNRTVTRFLTVPEGLTSAEIWRLLAEAPGLTGEVGPAPPEGTILPETWGYSYGDSRASLALRMQRGMEKLREELWPNRQAGLPLESWKEAVILASIVEKETGLVAERPHVAAVFYNRLKKRMLLQSDPTVIYAVTEGTGKLDRPLRYKDLKLKHPYNTYVVRGLPPGPISNPGRAALEAVLHPADSQNLYFVADGAGGHAFARTLAEHNRNVARWREHQAATRRNEQ